MQENSQLPVQFLGTATGKNKIMAKIKMTEDEKAQQLVIDYKQTFMSEHGQRVLAHIKKLAKFNMAYLPTDTVGRIDPMEVMRYEGSRCVIIHIETMLNKEPGESKGIQDHE